MNKEQIIPLYAGKIEDFDYVSFDWIDKKLNIFCNTNNGWKKVPILFASPERSFSSKSNKDIRDNNGTLIYPIISVERTEFVKPLNKSSVMPGYIPAFLDYKKGSINITRRISPESNAKFANRESYKYTGQINFPRKNKKIVYEILTIPQPTFVELSYKIQCITNYQQQMNDILAVFATKYGNQNYTVEYRNEIGYELFLDENFQSENNVSDFSEEERIFKTNLTLKIRGFIYGSGENQETPNVVKREAIVEVSIKPEFIVKGSIEDYIKKLKK
jgi:hypothetical protein